MPTYWTFGRPSSYRRRGIATRLVRQLADRVPGQHIGLQTDDAQPFYLSLGFHCPTRVHVLGRRELGAQRAEQRGPMTTDHQKHRWLPPPSILAFPFVRNDDTLVAFWGR